MRLALTLVTLLLAALSAGAFSAGAQAPPIRIGFASAMSGPAAITGEGVRWGAMPVVKEIGVPMVIEACSHPKIRELSGKGGNEWTFRVALDDEIMAYTFARYMARQGVKSSSVLAMNNDFGRGAAVAYEAAFKKAGVTLVSTEFFDSGQPDYRPVLTRLKRANPETILGVSLAAITLKWAVVPAIEIALKKHGKADRQTIRAALKEVDVKDSPLGPIKFDDNHQAWINMILLEMRDGQLRILEKLQTSPALLN